MNERDHELAAEMIVFLAASECLNFFKPADCKRSSYTDTDLCVVCLAKYEPSSLTAFLKRLGGVLK